MSFPIGSLTIGLREGGGEGGGLRAWGLLQQIWNPPSVLLSRPLPLSRMGAIEFPTTVRKGGLQRPLSVFTPKILRTQIGGVQSISAIQILPGRHRHPGLERWQTWSPGSSPVQDLNITIKTSQTNILQVSSPPYYTELLSHRDSSFFGRAICSIRNVPNLGAWRVSDRKPLILKNTIFDFKIQCFLCKIEINEIYT